MLIVKLAKRLFTVGKAITLGMPNDALDRDPIQLFGEWIKSARDLDFFLPESMSLSTVSANGKPSARMVLLKNYSPEGFTFYTNYASRKCRDLEGNPNVALLFHWNILQRQIRVEGTVVRVPKQESEAYFSSRDRGSQIGTWASKQSAALQDRVGLEQREKKYREKFRDQIVPLPEFWGGYRVCPERIEFWQGRANRLHDRVLFEKNENAWTAGRLYP
jgi:pyridoxamine 5'-phosphate oxidase